MTGPRKPYGHAPGCQPPAVPSLFGLDRTREPARFGPHAVPDPEDWTEFMLSRSDRAAIRKAAEKVPELRSLAERMGTG